MPTNALVRVLVKLALVALVLGFVFALVKLLAALSGAIVIVTAGVLLAYAVAPTVRVLRLHVPGAIAIALTYLVLLAVVAGILLVVVPPLAAEMQQLFVSIPTIAESAQRAIFSSGLLDRLPAPVQANLNTLSAQFTRLMASYGLSFARSGLNAIVSAATILISLVVIPVLAAYLLFDAPELRRAALGFIAPNQRPRAMAIMADISDTLGAFIRGQIVDCVIVGTLIGVMLALNRIPYALLIGVVSAVLNFVPYLSIVTVIPSVLLALAFNGWQNALLVGGLYAVIQQLDGNLIEPYVMRVSVALKPSVLIVSIVAFTALFGPFGTFIAVPLAALLRVIKLHLAPAPMPEELDADEARSIELRRFRR